MYKSIGYILLLIVGCVVAHFFPVLFWTKLHPWSPYGFLSPFFHWSAAHLFANLVGLTLLGCLIVYLKVAVPLQCFIIWIIGPIGLLVGYSADLASYAGISGLLYAGFTALGVARLKTDKNIFIILFIVGLFLKTLLEIAGVLSVDRQFFKVAAIVHLYGLILGSLTSSFIKIKKGA